MMPPRTATSPKPRPGIDRTPAAEPTLCYNPLSVGL